jgi:hypothetical protein
MQKLGFMAFTPTTVINYSSKQYPMRVFEFIMAGILCSTPQLPIQMTSQRHNRRQQSVCTHVSNASGNVMLLADASRLEVSSRDSSALFSV